MAEQFWAACQTITGQEHIVRAEIEKMDRGAFLPTYVRSAVSRGRLSDVEKAAVPGYVFFRATVDMIRSGGRTFAAENWSPIQDVDGVIGVLADGDRARRISSADMAKLVLDHASGVHNRLEVAHAPQHVGRRKSRKPRPCKRIRMRGNTGQ